MKNIHENYGQSKFLITVGDSVSFGGIQNDATFVEKIGGNISTYDAVYMGGVNAHNRTREMVLEAGFEHLLPVVGDHELGGMYFYKFIHPKQQGEIQRKVLSNLKLKPRSVLPSHLI